MQYETSLDAGVGDVAIGVWSSSIHSVKSTAKQTRACTERDNESGLGCTGDTPVTAMRFLFVC